jgi:hypothetical protein
MVRTLSSAYTGPLYQVRRTSDGQTKDIKAGADGYANASDQDAFLGTAAGTVSKLYDQSGKGNDLIKAPAGCYTGTAALPDNEANAKGRSVTVGGHKVYALYMIPQDGYRNNKTTGMPTGSQSQGIYEIADGKRGNGGCCWDFGNGSTDNCSGGTGNMNTLFFGVAFWGKGADKGPWFMADLEAGVWAGGSKDGDPGWGALSGNHTPNPNDPAMTMDYAFGILKTSATNYAIRVANAQSGGLTTAYDGNVPAGLHWTMHGGILLGIGGDNSNSSFGTFFEGAITAGRPSDSVDSQILKNVQAAGYGSSVIGIRTGSGEETRTSGFAARYLPSQGRALIRYSSPRPGRATLEVFDHAGRRVALLADGAVSQGPHEAVWNAATAPSGVYLARLSFDGHADASERFLVYR